MRKEILGIRREKDILSSRLMYSYERYQEKKASVEEFERTVACHKKQIGEFEARERDLISKMKELDQKVDSTEAWIKTVKECQKESNLTRKVVDSLVDKITIFDGPKIQVELCFEEEPAAR